MFYIGNRFIAGVIIMLLLVPFYALKAEEHTKNILVLNSYHLGWPWSDKEMEGISLVFGPQYTKIKLTQVYMDSKRYSYEQIKDKVYYMFSKEIDMDLYDLVITLDDNAFTFVLEHKDRFFRDIPIVFGGVNKLNPNRIKGIDNITGVVERQPLEQNLEMFLRNHPEMKTLVLLGDSTESGKTNVRNAYEMSKTMPKYMNIDVVPKVDWKLADIKEYLSKLDQKTTVVFFLDFYRDIDGLKFTVEEAAAILSKYDLQLYSNYYFEGTLGGYMLDPTGHGKETALVAQQVLNGTSPNDIFVTECSEESIFPVFNHKQLIHHGIPFRRIPSDSMIKDPVLNNIGSLSDGSGASLMMWLIAIVLLQTALILVFVRKALKA